MLPPTENANAFRARVRLRLEARTGDNRVLDTELPLIAAGLSYGIGPDDVACQIIANRADD